MPMVVVVRVAVVMVVPLLLAVLVLVLVVRVATGPLNHIVMRSTMVHDGACRHRPSYYLPEGISGGHHWPTDPVVWSMGA